MKTAVVFYSLDGNCAVAAKEIARQLNADLLRLQLPKEKKRSFIGNMFWGCGMVFFRKKPKLAPYEFDVSAYDLIILGSPVWAGQPAPPVKTFISNTNLAGKKIALFVCHAGGKGNSLEKFKKLFSDNEIIAEIDFLNAVKNYDETKQKIEQWVSNLKNLIK